jgi:hypothetical protein
MPTQEDIINALRYASGGADLAVPPPQSPAALPRPVQDAVQGLLSGIGGAVGSAVDAAKVPGQIASMRPETPGMWSEKDQMNEDAANNKLSSWAPQAAMTLAGMGAPAAEAGAAGIFGGRMAQGADLGLLQKAQQLDMKGYPSSEIHFNTGWFKGVDGKWRFEIPDQNAGMQTIGAPNLGGAMDHPELYKNYPNLASRPVVWDKSAGNAGYSSDGTFHLSPNNVDTPTDLRSAMHESQHAVQNLEGFSPGTNPTAMMEPTINEYQKRGYLTPQQADRAKNEWAVPNAEIANLLNTTAHETYMRHAGEVEARNVGDRQPFSNLARQQAPPMSTQDRPSYQQIVTQQKTPPLWQTIQALKK